MSAAATMPRWKCHKVVHALKLAAVEIKGPDKAVLVPAERNMWGPVLAPPGWLMRFRAQDNDPGYFVSYDDGHTSWSPTKAFEEGYTRIPADNWLDRLKTEKAELDERITKLEAFIDSGATNALEDEAAELLKLQAQTMRDLQHILGRRIGLA